MEIEGKNGKAIIYNDHVEQEAISQIYTLLNQPMAEDAHIRVMPDVHAGAGCVIGFTAKMTDKIVPNLIGVDIGCGVTAYKIGNKANIKTKFDKLDRFIRDKVPAGKQVNSDDVISQIGDFYHKIGLSGNAPGFKLELEEVAKRTQQDVDYVKRSIGSLGGGNHFIEVDEDDNHDLWVIVHTGSRNFGLKVAKYHQKIAEETTLGFDKEEYDRKVEEIKRTKKGKGIETAINKLRKEMMSKKKGKVTGLEYLEDDKAQQYLHDMEVAQKYARLNRLLIIDKIISGFYKQNMEVDKAIESTHNYINFDDGIIRKGAISANKGQRLIIPLNMADGVIVGYGKGNLEWNNSAPHGAGRKLSRSKAKSGIRLEDYQKVMKDKGVWTTSVNQATLDEAPQAYKKSEDIISYLHDTVDVEVHMKPIYNFKASEA